jgi:prefoldin beta subunit
VSSTFDHIYFIGLVIVSRTAFQTSFISSLSDIQKLYVTKTTTLAQFNENTLVKGELDMLSESEAVYKLVGPVLMKVELDDAKENVTKRVEFIEAEIKKIDGQIAAKQALQTDLGEEIQKLQTAMKRDAAQAAQATIAP